MTLNLPGRSAKPPAPAAACAALLALLVLAAPPARADAVADEADFRFNHAANLLRAGKVEEALGEFLASNRLVRNRNVIFNVARCFEILKMPNEAHRFYSEILGDEMPEADRRSLQAALERLRPSLALLEVRTEPPGATVWINRKDLGARGQTPLSLALKPARDVVMIELAGYKPVRAEVTTAIGKTATVSAPLERIYGAIEAAGTPEEFELTIDGGPHPLLTRPGSARALPGVRRVRVAAPGHVAYETQLEVPPEGTARLSFKLMPIPLPTGQLVVKANLDGAEVRVDGRVAGFTPTKEDVAAGTHKVEISADGREPIVRLVEIRIDRPVELNVRLRYAQPKVVAAERKLTRAEDAPASITVMSGDEVRAFGYATLAEALRAVRGFYISDDREYPAIGSRGFSPVSSYNSRVLVLNDGHVTNEISYGQGSAGRDFDPDLSEIERIEIVRGPGSVLYGSAAFFGVVNVVHRVPPPGLHLRAAGTIGSLGEQTGHISGSFGDDEHYLWLRGSATDLKNDQLFASPSSPPNPNAGLVAQDLDYEYAGHGDLRARWGDLTVNATYNYRKKNIPTGAYSSYFGEPGSNQMDRRAFAEANFNHTFDSGFGVDLRGAYDAYRNKANWNYDPDGPGVDTLIADWLTGEARIRLPEVLRNRIFLGGEFQARTNVRVTSAVPPRGVVFDNQSPDPKINFGAPSSESVFSVYLGDDITFHKRFRLNAAFRLDDWLDSFGAVFNPRVVAILQPYDEGTTKLIFGQAFRGPGFAERYYQDGLTTAANPALGPERITTFELEHTHLLTDEVSVMATGYYSRISDLIGNVDLKDGPLAGQAQLQNLPGVTTSSGVEAEARWQPAPGALLSFWYAWSRVHDDQGNPLANSPEHSGAVRFMYPVIPGTLSFATEVIYGGPRLSYDDPPGDPQRRIGETLRWNAGIAGAYNRWGIRYGIYAQNILDERAPIPAGPEVPFPSHAVPQYGRVIRFQLAGTF